MEVRLVPKILLTACHEPETLSQRLREYAQEMNIDIEFIIAKDVDEAIKQCDGSAADVVSVIRGCLDIEESKRLVGQLAALGFKGSTFAAAEALDLISREKGEE